MADRQNHAQNRAHKQNLGILQAHEANLIQLEKDKRKRLQTVDQELMEAYKFLEQIKTSSGNSITYEEAYIDEIKKQKRKFSTLDQPPEQPKHTKSSLMRIEVQMRKALCESRFKVKSTEFFEKWSNVFQMDLELDSHGLEDVDSKNAEWLELQELTKSFASNHTIK